MLVAMGGGVSLGLNLGLWRSLVSLKGMRKELGRVVGGVGACRSGLVRWRDDEGWLAVAPVMGSVGFV